MVAQIIFRLLKEYESNVFQIDSNKLINEDYLVVDKSMSRLGNSYLI